MTETDASRRNLLAGMAATGVALPLLAACGSGGGTDTTGTTGSGGSGGSSGSAGSSGSSGNGSGSGGGGGIPTSEIPVGGGKIFAAAQVVVTQPTAGQFKAFSAVCTHQGCTVAKVAGGAIECPCHFSKFSIRDGSVEAGPAPSPLQELAVTVSGDTLTVA